jgi:hypothetical protein
MMQANMTSRRLGYLLLALGAGVAVTSWLADALRPGSPGIQAAQVFGLQVGAVAAAAGAWLAFRMGDRSLRPREWLRKGAKSAGGWGNGAWILLGFALAYLALVVQPMFLQAGSRMVYFNKYLPDTAPIGSDLLITTDVIRGWLEGGESPYLMHFYPPFAYVALAPLLLVDHTVAYRIITGLTLAGFGASMMIVWALQRRRKTALTLLVAVTGLISYGVQFELERGQWNVIAMTLILAAIAVFHGSRGWRPLAYLLFTVGVQLKAYPVVFALMLIDDWHDGKATLRRMGGLAALNFAALFIGGPRLGGEALGAIAQQFLSPSRYFWNGNHSISNFVFGLGFSGYGLIPEKALEGWRLAGPWIAAFLLGLLVAGFVLAAVRLRRERATAPDPFLMLLCTLAALIIPISNDYKLSILAAPMAMALAGLPDARRVPWPLLASALITVASAAYAAVLVPFAYRPPYLANSFPLLLLILLTMTALGTMKDGAVVDSARGAQEPGAA